MVFEGGFILLKNIVSFDPIDRIWIPGGFQPSVHSETASSTIFYLLVWKMTFFGKPRGSTYSRMAICLYVYAYVYMYKCIRMYTYRHIYAYLIYFAGTHIMKVIVRFPDLGFRIYASLRYGQ